MLSDGRGMTMRLDDSTGAGVKVQAYAIAGTAAVSDAELQLY